MSTFNLRPISDMGGQKVLGMSGSLNGYINTGNAYDPRYNAPDSVEISNKAKSKRKLKDFLTLIGLAGGTTAAIILGKNGKLTGIKKAAGEFFEKIKTSFKDMKLPSKEKVFETVKKPFVAVKEAFQKLFKKSV